MSTKYPEIKVKLLGKDGNAFAIIGNVVKALRKHDVKPEEIKLFQDDAMSGDYDHLLQVCIKWVSIS